MNTITLTDEINAISIELTDVEGLQDLTETIDLSEDKTLTFSVTGEISVIGNSGYQFIKDYFFRSIVFNCIFNTFTYFI